MTLPLLETRFDLGVTIRKIISIIEVWNR